MEAGENSINGNLCTLVAERPRRERCKILNNKCIASDLLEGIWSLRIARCRIFLSFDVRACTKLRYEIVERFLLDLWEEDKPQQDAKQEGGDGV
jgi:hypothetical protein